MTETIEPITDFFTGLDLTLDAPVVKPSLKQKLLHYFGLCYKARMGYHCHGSNQYRECE